MNPNAILSYKRRLGLLVKKIPPVHSTITGLYLISGLLRLLIVKEKGQYGDMGEG